MHLAVSDTSIAVKRRAVEAVNKLKIFPVLVCLNDVYNCAGANSIFSAGWNLAMQHTDKPQRTEGLKERFPVRGGHLRALQSMVQR
jgi:hypothetical protein